MKLEEHPIKPAVRRFFGKDSNESGVRVKSRLGRAKSIPVDHPEKRVSSRSSRTVIRVFARGP